LIFTQIASLRIMISVIAGGLCTAWIFNVAGIGMFTEVSAYQQLLMGGFLFGAVYMATDPVSASHTKPGKIIYGFLIGVMAILIRTLNKGYPEGMMLAILLMNIFAPLVDYCVIQITIKRKIRWSRSQSIN
ncbi:MAG: RnfABCDGE type electron transport complex subunit D, partial [Bacteroidales bacterium]